MMNGKMCSGHKVAWVLVIVGALNWGLIGVAKFNLVMTVFGSWPMVERLVYFLVGVAGVMMLGLGKCCMKGGMCKCDDGKCGHCGPEDKPAMPVGGMDKKM
jgi:hypothetical protein